MPQEAVISLLGPEPLENRCGHRAWSGQKAAIRGCGRAGLQVGLKAAANVLRITRCEQLVSENPPQQ